MELPKITELKSLETVARINGSGLEISELIGRWNVREIWSKGSDRPSAAGGLLLRSLAATLEIDQKEKGELKLSNTISLGVLRLTFYGPGRVKTKRPLLFFSLTRMEIRIGKTKVFTLALPQAPPNKQPFFALIAAEHAKGEPAWLAARGRGGGVALWERQRDFQE